MATQLGPWTQGPFPLGADLVVGADERSYLPWEEIGRHLPDDLATKRVLVVGSKAGYDAFMYAALGARLVVGCEPSRLHRQATFLESIYKTGVRFYHVGWHDITAEQYGQFDVIHCHEVVHRDLHPVLLLGRLRKLLASRGTALIGGPLLGRSEGEQHARFIQEEYAGDAGWWWLPGRKALRRMLRVAGFDVRDEFEIPSSSRQHSDLEQCLFQVAPGVQAERRFPVAAQTIPVAGHAEHVVAKQAYAPGHFYSPVPDVRKLASEPTRSRVWPPEPHATPGIDWRPEAQVELCTKVFARQAPLDFPTEATDDPTEYFATNQQLAPLDAWILQAVLRHVRPSRMIEMGSGFSSLVSARVNREFLEGGMRFTCIEPYPRPFLLAGVEGISGLRVEEVQDTPLELFDELKAGDVLFVDTSHTVKTGGEVPWVFSQVIPRLNPGVVVHVHDVYLPGDYPKQWVLEEGRNWNENYLVEAFLSFNSDFELLFSAQWMIQHHRDALLEAFPGLIDPGRIEGPLPPFSGYFMLGEHSGSSLWIQRRA